jgi:NADH-quinone oxidoreductase subunit C
MRTNSISPGAKFLEAQDKVIAVINEKYSAGRKIEFDKLNEVIVWAKDPDDAHDLVGQFMKDAGTKIDFLSDITAYDNKDHEDGECRFILVYQLYSIDLHVRIRIKCHLNETQQAVSLVDLFLGANWLEREVYDMYGITFKNHPNLRRIMMDERFSGFPLRKEYPMKQREPYKDNIRLNLGANPLEVDTHVTESEK